MTDLERALGDALGALAAEPENPALLSRAGAVLAALGRTREALPLLERAAALDPAATTLNNLGAVLRSLDRLTEAMPYFFRAVELAPEYADARYNLAGALATSERFEESVAHFRILTEARPASSEIFNAYGAALLKAGRHDEGVAALERAVALAPESPDALAALGNAHVEGGRFDEAVAHFERAIALNARRPELYRHLVEVRPRALTAEHVAALQSMALDEAALTDDERIDLHFALGKMYDARGERASAFRHLVTANAHKRRFIAYDERETLSSLERIAAVFDAQFLASRRGCADPSPVPAFVFGMPRSGTTLIEQILASHPAVHAAGELAFFEETTNAVVASGGSVQEDAMLRAGCDELREIGRRYVERLRAVARPDAARVTDKMPSNFRYAGLIHTVLPQARMIHAMRDPVDTCLSCFSHYFAGDQPWAYDLRELGRYYRGYRALMEHWRAVLPADAMLEVRYEDVVEDLETQARRIVAFCGLEWDDACLEFYRTQRPVRTASATQVRRPIYRTSVQRAKEYGTLLNPLLEALGDVVPS